MTETRYEAVIVGAGLAGLTAAWELRDRHILVLEATDRVGGRIMSEPRSPYWLNLGAHLFGGPGSLVGRLTEQVGLETRLIPGNRMALAAKGKILATGRPETYPLRLPLSPSARLSFIRAALKLRVAAAGFLRVARPRPGETPAHRRARVLAYRDDRTFADYLGPMHPDVAAIFRAIAQRITAEPHEISAGCGAMLFAAVWGDDKTLARNLIGGSALLPQTLAQRLGERVVTRASVEDVAAEPGGTVRVRVREPQGARDVVARCAIVTTPAYVTRRIVRDLPDDTLAALDGIPYGPFVCGAFLTAEPGPMPWDGIYAIAVADRSFNMLFNHANVVRGAGRREPGGSLMVYGGGEAGRRLLQLGDDQIEAAFLRDLHAVLPETRGIVKEVRIQRWEKALPFARPGRRLLQPGLERSLGNVFLAGDYLEFAEMEVAAESGQQAAQAARRKLEGG